LPHPFFCFRESFGTLRHHKNATASSEKSGHFAKGAGGGSFPPAQKIFVKKIPALL
jgi:hypothetical protein